MDTTHGVASCRWATPTLFLSQPLWLHAWDSPWGCIRGGIVRVLHSSELCTGCSKWEPRGTLPRAGDSTLEFAPGDRLRVDGAR
jgi:hypothetical protein